MGGIELVAIALSESPTIEEFGLAVGMTENEIENLKVILVRKGIEMKLNLPREVCVHYLINGLTVLQYKFLFNSNAFSSVEQGDIGILGSLGIMVLTV